MLSQKQLLKNATQMLVAKQYKKVVNLILPTLKAESEQTTLGASHALLGKAFYQLEEYTQAIDHLNAAITYLPKDDKLQYYLGLSYFAIRRLEMAKSCFQQAIELNPKPEQYFLNLAAVYRHMERLDSAEKCYREIIARASNATKAYRNMSLCVRYTDLDHPDRSQIEHILKNEKLSNEEKAQCYFSLGKIYRDCNKIEKGFDHYSNGNYFKNKDAQFNRMQYAQKILDIMNLFPPEQFQTKNVPLSPPSSSQPIFIIGIPRSGKTLVEKCLSTQSQVLALEEFGIIDKQVFNTGRIHQYKNLFMDLKSELNPKLISKFVYEYERQVQMRALNSFSAFTDTTPCNFRYLGFIALMYPNAKIIHAMRNPFDHILQIFFKYFSTGNFWAYDIINIIHYYNEYRKIMSYWQKVLPISIKEVRYEKMIENPIDVIQDLHQFAELEFKQTPALDNIIEPFHRQEIGLWETYKPFFASFEYHLNKLNVYDILAPL